MAPRLRPRLRGLFSTGINHATAKKTAQSGHDYAQPGGRALRRQHLVAGSTEEMSERAQQRTPPTANAAAPTATITIPVPKRSPPGSASFDRIRIRRVFPAALVSQVCDGAHQQPRQRTFTASSQHLLQRGCPGPLGNHPEIPDSSPQEEERGRTPARPLHPEMAAPQ